MPRNFSLRTLLLAGAAAGIALNVLIGLAAERRRAAYRARVESLAFGEADIVEQIADKLKSAREAEADGPRGQSRAESLRLDAERLARLAAWHVKMERRYAWAAEHPWEPLPPDHPKPAVAIAAGAPSD